MPRKVKYDNNHKYDKARRKEKKKASERIAVVDFETDPFLEGRIPVPFSAGFFDGKIYREFWDTNGVSCVDQLCDYLLTLDDEWTIFAHNGGKFDFFFFIEKGVVNNPVMLINGRIVKAGFLGRHTLRDSYAMMPIPLAAFDKGDIDYAKLESNVREQHREEISRYLKRDCTSLYKLVTSFIERFGNKITVGATAIAQLSEFHPVARRDKSHDGDFRPFYFGGRVECFESGVLRPSASTVVFVIHDVNSMYPKAMEGFDHPASEGYVFIGTEQANTIFNKKTGRLKGFSGMYFMHFRGWNKGALPCRFDKDGEPITYTETGKPTRPIHSTSYDTPYGDFYACSHEIEAAIELGLLEVETIHFARTPFVCQRFKDYVDHWMAEKIKFKTLQTTDPDNEMSHKANETFAKLMLNSAYGKFAADPSKYKEHYFRNIDDDEQIEDFINWRQNNPEAELLEFSAPIQIWQAPAPSEEGYFDVAVAASITSAARSILLRAIRGANRPIYCDTDSLISEGISGVTIDDKELGAWKFEGSCTELYVAGKKMYCAVDAVLNKDGTLKDKIASKGAKLGREDIRLLASREVEFIEWKNAAPNFKLSGGVQFVKRKIRATA